MRSRNRYRRSRRLGVRLLCAGILLLILGGTVLWVLERRLESIVETTGAAAARAVAVRAINRAVNEELAAENISYKDIIHFTTDNSGAITALSTDTVRLNYLEAALSDRILTDILASDEAYVMIPIGNLFGGSIFSGRGPRLVLKLVPVGMVDIEVENLFVSAGINQTRHQVMLRVNVQVSVLLPVSRVSTTAETSLCIAETILVGKVPESYMQMELPNEILPS